MSMYVIIYAKMPRPTTSIREVSIHPKKYWYRCISPPVRRAWGLCIVGSIGNRIMSWHLKRRVGDRASYKDRIRPVSQLPVLLCLPWYQIRWWRRRLEMPIRRARMWFQGQRSRVSISYDRDEENIKTDAPWRVVAWACEHVYEYVFM